MPLGLLAGYRGGLVDTIISRITDAMLAFPFLILAITLAAFLGPSLSNAMIAIGVTATPVFIRLTRGQMLGPKVEDYVEAARASATRVGASRCSTPAEHRAAAAGAGDAAIAAAIIAEAALSFLGSASSRLRPPGAAC